MIQNMMIKKKYATFQIQLLQAFGSSEYEDAEDLAGGWTNPCAKNMRKSKWIISPGSEWK